MNMYDILVDKINKLSFMDDNLLSIMKNTNTNKKQYVKKNNPTFVKKKAIKSIFFYPEKRYTDTLYWCWIIHKYGMDEYLMNENCIYQSEQTGKLSLITNYVQPNKKEIKKKFKMKYSDIESNCIYDSNISITVFTILMNYMNINVIYYDDHIYYENINEEFNELIIINKNKDNYGLCTNINELDIGNIKSSRLFVDNIYKPLKPISNYKVNELKEICIKFKLNIKKNETKFITKKEMYQLLKEILN